MSIVWEIIYTSLMVGATSYGLHYWARKKGIVRTEGAIAKPPKRGAETGKKQKRKTGDRLIDKWLGFGGGYYGTVTFLTFVTIELTEFFAFITDQQAIANFFNTLGIGTIIRFFIGQFQNFLAAILWFTDYIGDYPWFIVILWFAASYGAYKGGHHLEQHHFDRNQEG